MGGRADSLPVVGEPGSVAARPLTGPAVARPLTGLALADLISTTGTEMTAVALPWFVLTTTGSPARMGVVLAAEYAGLTLLGLAGARVATITGPRRLMLSADLTRAALIAAIPLLYWAHALSFPVILAISVFIGGFFPAYQSSSQLIVASLTGDDQVKLTRLGGLLSAVNDGEVSAAQARKRLGRSPQWGWVAWDPIPQLVRAIAVGERTLARAQR